MIDNLTGLRFYLAIWVSLYHVRDAIAVPVVSAVVRAGFFGVDVFFVLSGFILTHVYFQTFFSSDTVAHEDFTQFVKKRFARIYPLHLVTLIGAILLLNVIRIFTESNDSLSWNHILPHVFLIHAWGLLDSISWNFPSWSISAEWFAYLFIFPVSSFVYRKGGLSSLILLTACAIIIHLFVTRFYFDNNIALQLEDGIIRIVPEFLLGCVGCLMLRDRSWKKKGLPVFVSATLIVIAAAVIINLQFIFMIIVPIMLVALKKGVPWINVVFGSRPIVYLGEISFSIYMVHFFSRAINGILQTRFFGSETNSVLYFMNYLLLTLVFAIVSYHVIEMPLRKFIVNRLNFRTA